MGRASEPRAPYLRLDRTASVFRFAEEGDHHALDDEFVGWDEVGVLRVFGAQEGAAVFDQVAFQGGFAVDEGGHDVAVVGFAQFEHDEIAVENVRTGHGLAADAHGEGAGGAADVERVEVGVDAAVGALLARLRKSRRDVAVDGNGGDFFAVVAGDAQ